MQGTENKPYVCLICGADYSDREPRKRQGAFNLHKRNCILKHFQKEQEEKRQQQSSEEDCAHNWRLLQSNIMIEKRAMNKGMTEVCTKCQEVQ